MQTIVNLLFCTLSGNGIKEEKRLVVGKKSVFDVWSSVIEIKDCFHFDFFVVEPLKIFIILVFHCNF